MLFYLHEAWSTLCQMAPYLLFGFFFAGVLSVLISPETVQRHLGGRGFIQVLKASLFGVPLPLCSCGVIPVFASLRKNGAGKGAVTSFLISTPQTGIDSILVTYSMLGPVLAVFRPLAALVSGIIGGLMVDMFDKDDEAGKDEKKEETCCCHEKCCEEKAEKKGNIFVRILKYGFVTLMDDIALSLAGGIMIAAGISMIIPENWFASAIGTGLTGMLFMMACGIPLYVCATASVPIAAMLIAKGVGPGAAFVFLMTGPATNAAAIAIVWKTLGRKATVLYLLSLLLSAIALGFMIDHIPFLGKDIVAAACQHNENLSVLQQVSAGILLLLISVSLVKSLYRKKTE